MKEVTFTVDGKKITVPEGTLIIDACEQSNIYIPRFCYHKHLSKSGNCRMCLVKIEKNPKPQPSCMTPATEGMIVYTNTPEIIQMRKAMLEFILINHPLDCPICDKAGECMLQDQYMMFSGDKSRFNETKVAKEKLYHFSDKIIYDAERCIACSRCVRFSREVSKTNKLGLIKRGDSTYVALAPGDTFDDPYSLCVTDICPVGALTSARFRFKERVWNLTSIDSICAGCSRGCNITIQTKDNRIYRILPRENRNVNITWMCDFGREYYTRPIKNRHTGISINHKPAEYKKFISEVAQQMKSNAHKLAFILSSYATNEELALAGQLADSLGIAAVFSKADRVWHQTTGEIEADSFLITADKTPNSAGVKSLFPRAKDISELILSDFTHAFVWGQNAPVEKLAGLNIISLSAISDQIAEKAKWSIAGRLSTEKHGSFTNCDGRIQAFRKAIQGENNYDELTFFVDILKELGVQPIGRTVQEVRASFK
ncbi:MAG: 2Fe-2S iron-sulfur cluster-binding protein [Candidatus Zhuqueibacterota bacterium]